MILYRIFFYTFIFLLLSAQVHADALFDQANETFSKGNYSEAITLYEQLAEEKGHSASLYYNIANSYAQLGENGKAVVNYERSLRLSPDHADIIKNFSSFKKEAGLFLDEQPTVDKLFNLLTPDQWSYLALFFLVVATSVVIFWKKLSQGSMARAVVSLAVFSILSALSGFAGLQTYLLAPSHVVIKDTRLMISPFESAESKGVIKSGRTASPGKEYKSYVHIEDDTGQLGWIEKSSLEAVVQNTL